MKQRAELTLLANLAIGWHEQTRLQPQITEALDAAFDEPVKLRRELLGYLLRLRIGFGLRVLLNLIPGRSTAIKRVLDELDAGAKQIAHEAITEGLMTLALSGEVLSLSRDVPGAFPADLQAIDNRDLRALLELIDPTPDTTRGSGADDWSNLTRTDPLHRRPLSRLSGAPDPAERSVHGRAGGLDQVRPPSSRAPLILSQIPRSAWTAERASDPAPGCRPPFLCLGAIVLGSHGGAARRPRDGFGGE